MSGILGIWHLDGRPVDRGELFRLSSVLRHRGRDADGLRVDGDAALACCLGRITPEAAHEAQPAIAADGTMLVLDGRLDDRDDLVATLAPRIAVANDSPDSALALAAYRVFGDDFPARLSGDFAIGLFDSRRQRMLLARDAVGIRPLYYSSTPNLFLFASEIKALVSHPDIEAQPQDEALADFLFMRCVGQPPTSMTFFRNIVSVLPSHSVTVDRFGIRTRQYWDFDVTRRVTFRREGEYAEAFKEHFDRAVRRRIRAARPVAVWVSGGLDSSAVFCAAHALARGDAGTHSPPIGVSLTFENGTPPDEKAYLREVERACGSPIVRLHEPPLGFADGCRDAIWHAEGPLLDCQWNSTRLQLSAAKQQGAAVLLTGDGGDQFLFDDAYLVDLFRRGRWLKAWRHLNTYGRWMDIPRAAFVRSFAVQLLKYHVPHAVVAGMRRVRSRFRERPAAHSWYIDAFVGLARPVPPLRRRPRAAAHAHSVYCGVRSQYALTRLEAQNKTAAMHGLDAAFPFLDRDLIAFLMAIPGEMHVRNGVPKALLRDGYRGVMPDGVTRRRSKADFTDRVNSGAARDQAAVIAAVGNGLSIERQYVRPDAPDAVAAFRADGDPSSALNGWALCDLMSLELWLQEFIGPERRCQERGILGDALVS
jgi:asparagine synthase (glutamine-hydrolysing)